MFNIIDNLTFGKYKTEHWEFQKEKRFTIVTRPSSGKEKDSIKRNFSNVDLNTEYIDVDLSDKFFNNLKITYSPKMTQNHKIIIKALVKNLPLIELKESELVDVIR